MATEEIQSTLNNLIETCKDGEQGFKTAADRVKESSLKSLFGSPTVPFTVTKVGKET